MKAYADLRWIQINIHVNPEPVYQVSGRCERSKVTRSDQKRFIDHIAAEYGIRNTKHVIFALVWRQVAATVASRRDTVRRHGMWMLFGSALLFQKSTSYRREWKCSVVTAFKRNWLKYSQFNTYLFYHQAKLWRIQIRHIFTSSTTIVATFIRWKVTEVCVCAWTLDRPNRFDCFRSLSSST